jgi:hypothetical protein
MELKQLLLEIRTKAKHSISENDSRFNSYKELEKQGLIVLEQIKNTGVYIVNAN